MLPPGPILNFLISKLGAPSCRSRSHSICVFVAFDTLAGLAVPAALTVTDASAPPALFKMMLVPGSTRSRRTTLDQALRQSWFAGGSHQEEYPGKAAAWSSGRRPDGRTVGVEREGITEPGGPPVGTPRPSEGNQDQTVVARRHSFFAPKRRGSRRNTGELEQVLVRLPYNVPVVLEETAWLTEPRSSSRRNRGQSYAERGERARWSRSSGLGRRKGHSYSLTKG